MTEKNEDYEKAIMDLQKVIEKMGEKLAACDSLIASFVKYLNVLIE